MSEYRVKCKESNIIEMTLVVKHIYSLQLFILSVSFFYEYFIKIYKNCPTNTMYYSLSL